MAKNYDSIDDFDAEMEAKFAKAKEQGEAVEEEVGDEVQELDEETPSGDEQLEVDDDQEDDEEEESQEEVEKAPEEKPAPVKEDKAEHAFKKLREERNQALEEARKAKESLKALDEMAVSLGYKDHAELLATQKKNRMAEEAKKQGIDPTFYAQFQEMKEQLAASERQKAASQEQAKIQAFTTALDDVSKQYGLSAAERTQLLETMETDGYGLDDIKVIKNPRRLIESYLSDRIQKPQPQDTKRFKEEKFNSPAKPPKNDRMLREIDSEMAKYAKENGLPYERKYKD